MRNILSLLINNQSLSQEEARLNLLKIGLGEINPAQIAAFLMGIQSKGISVEEMEGFRDAMLELAINIDLSAFDAMDVCGTGGDGKDTFNISTTAAFIVAGAGQNVAKHGNHGVSSAVGSSTVLEYLGVEFSNDVEFLKSKIETAGICYLHAPLFHPAMRFVGPIRKELGVKTFFNILGPLLNPSKVKKQITGVYDQKVFDLYHQIMLRTDMDFAIIYDVAGYDEVSLTADFQTGTKHGIEIHSIEKFNKYAQSELSGGETLEDSAKIMVNILENKGTKAQTDVAITNAGLALSIARNYSLEAGIDQATESLKQGKALRSLKILIQK